MQQEDGRSATWRYARSTAVAPAHVGSGARSPSRSCAAGAATADDWRDHVTFTLSDRARGEFVDWFRPPDGVAPAGAERYAFFGNQLRAGVRVVLPHVQLTLEAQDTRLANLPDDATLAAAARRARPRGALLPEHARHLPGRDVPEAGLRDAAPSRIHRQARALRVPRGCRDGAGRRDARIPEARPDQRAAGRHVRFHARDAELRRRPARLRRARLECDRHGASSDSRRFRSERQSRARRRDAGGPRAHREAPPVLRARRRPICGSSISTSRTGATSRSRSTTASWWFARAIGIRSSSTRSAATR